MAAPSSDIAGAGPRRRLRLDVTGAVQGVGFRPFVHRLAVSEGLGGFVRNTGAGVSVEVEGSLEALARFLSRLDAEIEPPAAIHRRQSRRLPVQGEQGFVIAPSATTGRRSAWVLPDCAICPACLREMLDPNDRRYLYPFTSCAQCGPRYSLIEAVPYDRLRTAMRRFPMCAACRKEYDEPGSRRFHAETSACPECGPQLALWDTTGAVLAERHRALLHAADALRQGRIVALKGLGGFQLLVDARNDAAVSRLRERKRRPAKPFALMVRTLADALAIAEFSETEQQLLCSRAAPIVLAESRADVSVVAPNVAPANPLLGIMLPYTPLHALLMRELGFPIVATSGNRGGEPIVIDERVALERLARVADLFLVHDRPILRPVDDSVVRVMAGREVVLRHARGYAPLALACPAADELVVALGAHQKSAIALAGDGQIALGPHIGDLTAATTREAFAQALEAMPGLYDVRPRRVACDAHPDYYSTRFAQASGLPVQRVPHHLAHVLAGMVDNELAGPVLGVAWDGAGYGADASIWGGEFLTVDATRFNRVAHLLPFRLAGGEAAIREPRRAALGALHLTFGEATFGMTDLKPVAAFAPTEKRVLGTMLRRGFNAPLTSSAGRLFDAIAALLDLVQIASFEGQAAMGVEFAAQRAVEPPSLSLATPRLTEHAGKLLLDWRPMLADIVAGWRDSVAAPVLAAAFHESLVEAVVAVAMRVEREQVLLSGGCFQNARLVEHAVRRLREAGFRPYWHRRVPPNDGGIAVGQALFAARPLTGEKI